MREMNETKLILPPTVSHVKSIISFSATGPMIPLAMISLPLLRIRGEDGGTENQNHT